MWSGELDSVIVIHKTHVINLCECVVLSKVIFIIHIFVTWAGTYFITPVTQWRNYSGSSDAFK